jgi:hypothetical protein
MPNVIMLNVILLNVVAPNEPQLDMCFFRWPFWQKTTQNPHITFLKNETRIEQFTIWKVEFQAKAFKSHISIVRNH